MTEKNNKLQQKKIKENKKNFKALSYSLSAVCILTGTAANCRAILPCANLFAAFQESLFIVYAKEKTPCKAQHFFFMFPPFARGVSCNRNNTAA